MKLLFFLFPLILSSDASLIDNLNFNEFNRLTNHIMTNYSRFDTIVQYLQSASQVCQHATLETIGTTYEGRETPMIKFSTNHGAKKPIIFIDAGMHAREWISTSTALYMIAQLCLPSNNELISNIDWYIIPVLNPDGYEYTHTDDRFWRKSRSWNGNSCYGADLNRNFDYKWMVSGSSSNECDGAYGGSHPFSEIESRNFRDIFEKYADRIKLYVSLHAFGKLIMYPYGYEAKEPYNVDELLSLGKLVSFNIAKHGGNDYDVGVSAKMIYETSGGSDDWAKGVMRVPLVYTIELPGDGFDPPPSEIVLVGEEIFQGFQVFYHYVVDHFA